METPGRSKSRRPRLLTMRWSGAFGATAAFFDQRSTGFRLACCQMTNVQGVV